MMHPKFLAILALVSLSSATPASLILSEFDQTSGTGLGAVNTVLTMERDPQAGGPESGCVAWDGSMDVLGNAACPPGSTIPGGDETGITETRTIAEVGISSAFNLRVVFNFNERQSGQQVDNVVLDDLVLTIFDTDGTVCFGSGPFTPVTFEDPASGTGNAGFVFRLDATQAAQADACFADPDRRIGLAAAATNASSDGGPETFFVADAADILPAAADLAVEKTDSPDPVAVSSTLEYTLTITNNGPNNAESVLVSDNLPPSVTFVSAVPDQGTCSESDGNVECSVGPLPAGESTSILITVTTGTAEQTITNSATVVGSPDDPDTSNNTATEQTVVGVDPGLLADVSIVKSDSPDPVLVGNTLTYTLVASNAGPDTAVSVVVDDDLPATLGSITASTADGTCTVSGRSVRCELGDLAAGASETVQITAVPSETGTLQNTGIVGSDTTDPDTTNNADDEQTAVEALPAPSADLSISKTDAMDPVAAGGTVEYTLTIVNDGPDPAVAVTVTDNLPSSLSNPSATPSTGSCSIASGTVECTLGDLAVGATATVVIMATAPNSDTTVTNNATVGADTSDPDTADNSASEQTEIGLGSGASADVSVTKNDTPDPLVAGDVLTYRLTVRNAGPDAAAGVVVTDALPASLAGATATTTLGTCSTTGDDVRCELGTLPADTSETITIQATTTEPGTLSNTAQVGADTSDPNTGNNSATEQTEVTAPGGASADVSVTKTDSMDPVMLGESFSYVLTVANAGPDPATAVEVSDSVPASLAVVAATASQGSCTVSGQQVACALGEIGPQESVTVTIDVIAEATGPVTNFASVAADPADPQPGNNSASETTAVGIDTRRIPTLQWPLLALLAVLLLLIGMRAQATR
ncbi:MAG: DUF11 domain-containing protein [Wenzhouxiangellaceae bacterium]|nr:DUF11 domain-containing protein [Wenzhouxiangellaceae bacterium]